MADRNKDMRLEEYKMLRKEIDDKINMTNSINLQMVASFLIFAGVGIYNNIRALFPFCSLFCVLMYFRIFYNHDAIARISAYMIIVLEKNIDIKWETRNHLIHDSKYTGKKWFLYRFSKFSGWASFIECLTFQIISIGLWVMLSYRNHYPMEFKIPASLEIVCLAGCFIAAAGLAVLDGYYHYGKKGPWLKRWGKYYIKMINPQNKEKENGKQQDII